MHFQHGHFRAAQPATPTPTAFSVHRTRVRDDLEIAYIVEGSGYPVLLLHGWPETKRIWWRNIEPLVQAGFQVVVPDLRGFGDSDVAPDDRHDITEYSLDNHDLMTRVLGHDRYSIAAGDVGGVVAIDMALRFADHVDRLCFFNSVPPFSVPPIPSRVSTKRASGEMPPATTGNGKDITPTSSSRNSIPPSGAGGGSPICMVIAFGPHPGHSPKRISTS